MHRRCTLQPTRRPMHIQHICTREPLSTLTRDRLSSVNSSNFARSLPASFGFSFITIVTCGFIVSPAASMLALDVITHTRTHRIFLTVHARAISACVYCQMFPLPAATSGFTFLFLALSRTLSRSLSQSLLYLSRFFSIFFTSHLFYSPCRNWLRYRRIRFLHEFAF